MSRRYIFSATLLLTVFVSNSFAQTILSQYEFNGDLTNSSSFVDSNLVVAPDGVLKLGRVSATAVTGTATFGTGVDGSPKGSLILDGVDEWIDVTTSGHPGESVPSGPQSPVGLISGTVMAWLKADVGAAEQASSFMGSTNSSPGDFQSWQIGWNGSRLEATAHAANSSSEGITVGDSTDNTSWADGDWHHVAIKWNGFTNSGGVFLDGVRLATDVSPGLLFNSPQSPWEFPMAIGAHNNGGHLEGLWAGMVDDLRIYQQDLSDANIATIFNETPVPSTPDFDSDLDVDGADFLIWQRGFGTGTTFGSGDANGSMTVDGTDLALWQSDYGQPVVSAVAAVQAVPEPTSLGLLLLGVLSFAARAVRQRTGS